MTELEKLVEKQEASFRKEFNEWVRKKRSQETLDQLQKLLENGQIYDAIDLMSDDANYWMLLFLTTYVAGGVLESRQYPFDYRFNPFINDFVNRQAENFSKFMRDSQRQALLNTAYREYQAGKNWAEVAKAIGLNVGLSGFQQRTLLKYENLLRADVSVEGRPLYSEKQIARLIKKRSGIMVEQRARLVATTEVGLLINEAREESFRQGVIAEGLDPAQATKTWVNVGDSKVRATHQHGSLGGQTVPLDQPFISSSGARLQRPHDPSAPPAERYNCRCHLTFSHPQAAEPN